MKRIIQIGRTAAVCAPAVCAGALSVAFPGERQRLAGVEQTYVIGAADSNRTELLYVNGVTTDVWRTGAFIAMVPVTEGTNTVTVCRGRERLVRTFTVAPAPARKAWEKFEPVTDAKDARLGPLKAWRTTGDLFQNRVREEPDGGETLFFLPKDFVLRGAEMKGRPWVAVWLEDRVGFLSKGVAKPETGVALPPCGLLAPDPAAGFPDAPPYGRPPSAVRVCIDAGHGGSDPGALSPHGWREKDVNLAQARAIRDLLVKHGFQVVMTRDGDTFPALLERPRQAYRERVDAFISVHHNATAPHRDPREARHTVTYASNAKGLALAAAIQKHLAAAVGADVPDKGAQLKSLAVCRNPAVPSCLLEVDFINLPEGEEASWDPERQRRVARAVAYGLLDWMTPPPPPPAPELRKIEPAPAAGPEFFSESPK